MDQKVVERISNFELELLKYDVRKSHKRMNELLADDFFEFAKDGKKYSKQEIIKILSQCAEEKISTTNFNVLEISSNAALVTYIADRELVSTGKKSRTLCSSIWQEHLGNWQMIFFQGTEAE